MMPRPINDAGLTLIKSFEQCRLVAYNDNPNHPEKGIWTIGWGHTGPEVVEGLVWSQQDADDNLLRDLAESCGTVERRIKVALNDNQFAALTSFQMNTGAIGDNQPDGRPWTIVRLLNMGFYAQVPHELAFQDEQGVWRGWIHQAGELRYGLVRRRVAESQLWSTPV